jgi:hypothetical protein
MDRVTGSSRLWLIVSLPPVITALGWIGTLAFTAMTGTHPIWATTARNLAEAAAFRDGGAVVRFVEAGQQIGKAAEVRGGVIRSETTTLTPVEAAAAARDEAVVQLLFDLGASPDAAGWHRAFCISDASRVREVLNAHRPLGVVEDCAQQ